MHITDKEVQEAPDEVPDQLSIRKSAGPAGYGELITRHWTIAGQVLFPFLCTTHYPSTRAPQLDIKNGCAMHGCGHRVLRTGKPQHRRNRTLQLGTFEHHGPMTMSGGSPLTDSKH